MRKIGNSKPHPIYLIKLQNGEFAKEIFDTEEEAEQYALANLQNEQYEIISFGGLMIYNNMNNENNRQTERKME